MAGGIEGVEEPMRIVCGTAVKRKVGAERRGLRYTDPLAICKDEEGIFKNVQSLKHLQGRGVVPRID